MAAELKAVQSPVPGRVIDFQEVAHSLKYAGNQITRFAVGETHGYFPSFCSPTSPESSTLYQIVVDAGGYTSLVVRAHELSQEFWGIRATIHFMQDELLCAAWMLADGIPLPHVTAKPFCVKCLGKECGNTCHPDINVSLVVLSALPHELIRWVRNNLTSDGFRSQLHRYPTLVT